jgi:hypothetical protein
VQKVRTASRNGLFGLQSRRSSLRSHRLSSPLFIKDLCEPLPSSARSFRLSSFSRVMLRKHFRIAKSQVRVLPDVVSGGGC